ncbi:MAG TPA: metalloregulator ArsR/SmtB family transcription factor [Puia sp.]|jgi:ArsR family transcriptional regulator|nr:metalloregulator ArsR/SmtB family transcription factor [Puia sp.]
MPLMDAKQAEKISKALSDPTRLKILSEIQKKHDEWLYCVDLYDNINLAQPSICHHLKQLTETSIILPEKEGRNIKYTMNNAVIDDYITFLQGLKK